MKGRIAMTREERLATLRFLKSNELGLPGRYRYSALTRRPVLYASAYAAMTRHLLGDPIEEQEEWLRYLQSYQEADGLFRDPVIYGTGWYEGDPLWCGRPHLTCHVLEAISCLGGTAEREITFADPWKDTDFLIRWLKDRDWGKGVADTGNEIMNVANILQYSRDYHADERAGRAVETILNWLSANRIDPSTGLWGDGDLTNPKNLSNAVQGAYHWWAVFFYEGRTIPYAQAAAAQVLRTQNPLGGFGQGVHNPEDPWQSSACEDIDSLDPLCRMLARGEIKGEEVRKSIRRGRRRVAENRMPDGGMVFYRGRPFEYGHPELYGAADRGAMFPTWFRTLTLAVCDTALGDDTDFAFVHCPGYQFPIETEKNIDRS